MSKIWNIVIIGGAAIFTGGFLYTIFSGEKQPEVGPLPLPSYGGSKKTRNKRNKKNKTKKH
jgi:hypothetical protein